jgi:hypothetical protein
MLLRIGYGVQAVETTRRPIPEVLLPDAEPVGAFGPGPKGTTGTDAGQRYAVN